MQNYKMKLYKNLILKIFLLLVTNQFFFNVPRVQSADNIKIIYGIFSRTIVVDSLKNFAENGYSSKKLKRILNATGSSDNEIQLILNKNFE